jgi:hypothetical protein
MPDGTPAASFPHKCSTEQGGATKAFYHYYPKWRLRGLLSLFFALGCVGTGTGILKKFHMVPALFAHQCSTEQEGPLRLLPLL